MKRFLYSIVFPFLTLIGFVVSSHEGYSQVVQTESFESTIFPAPGWKQVKALSASTAAFSRQAVSTVTQPGSPGIPQAAGAFVMMFNSASAPQNDTSFIITKPFDFSTAGAQLPTFSFKMYRDNNLTANNDQILVYVNTSPVFSGAVPVNHGGGVNFINRPYSSFPAVAANTWNTYTFTVPSQFVNGPKKCYIFVVGKSAAGQNIYIDDFRVNTFPSPTLASDVSMNVVQQNPADLGGPSTNQWIIGMRCVVGGNSGCGSIALGTAVKLDSLLLNTNGVTNLNDIQNARIWYTGGSQLFSTNYISPFPVLAGNAYPQAQFGSAIAVPSTNMNFQNAGGNCFHLEYDTTYFWLTYDIKSTAQGGNLLDAELRELKVSPGGGACPTPAGSTGSLTAATNVYALPGSILISLPYCVPTYTTGTSFWNYTTNDYIQGVEFLTGGGGVQINTNINSVALQDPAAPGYPNCAFTAHPPDYERWSSGPSTTVILTQGMTYNFRAQAGTRPSGNYIQAWIDYNHNGVFETTEKCVATPSALTANAWQNFTAVVPASGYAGSTRMRVREVNSVSNIDPCATYAYGECEDFDITILPNCPPGYKLWLGNSSDWNDPANWCGGVPTAADSAVINRSAPQVAALQTYSHPVIGSGVKASTKGLFISSGDTLRIDAVSPADTVLRIHGSLTQNGKFITTSGASNFITISNGTLESSLYTPFRGNATDARLQVLYSAAELSSMGVSANDTIDQIRFTILSLTSQGQPGKNSTQPYNGFTISYGLVAGTTSQFASNQPLTASNVVFGPASFSTVSGLNVIQLATPIIWNGVSSLVLQFCFDNASVSGSDVMNNTQTTGRKTALMLTSNSGSGCSLVPGAGVSDNFFASAAVNRPNFIFRTNRVYGKPQIAIKGNWQNNGVFTAGLSRVVFESNSPQSIGGSVSSVFHELNIEKNTLSNAVTLQTNITVQDTLLLTQGQLKLNGRTLSVTNPAAVQNTGGASATTFTGPISRVSGLIIAEDTVSRVKWNSSGIAAPVSGLYRVIPFGNAALNYIPFSFRQTSGDLGIFSVGTYATNAQNQLYPPTVFHVNDTGLMGTDNSAAAVDRFWLTEKGNTPAVTDLVFRWAASERNTLVPVFNALSNPPRAYPWRLSSNGIGTWLKIYSSPGNSAQLMTAVPYTQTANATFDSVVVRNFDWPQVVAGNAPWPAPQQTMPFALPWVVAGSSNAGALGNGAAPLTVSLTVTATCSGQSNGSIALTVTSGVAPFTYLWNDGTTIPNRSSLNAGTYTVTVTDASGMSDVTTATVGTVTQVPVQTNVINGPTRVCPGSTGIVYQVGAVAQASVYDWVVPAGMTITSGFNTRIITVSVSAAYLNGDIKVRAGNGCGYGPFRTKNVRTIVPAQPGQVTGPAYGVCSAVVSYSIAAVTNATTYQWTAPAGAQILNGQGTTTVSISYPGNYVTDTLRVRAGNPCNYGPERKVVVRGQPQSPGVISGPSTACNGQTGVGFSISPVYGAVSYTWNKPSGTTITSGQGTTNAFMTFGANSGNVTVKAINGCGGSGNSIKAVTVNCREGEMEPIVSIYPNPSAGSFLLTGDFTEGPVLIEVYSLNGQLVFSSLTTEPLQFGSALPSGVYSARITSGNALVSEKLVKL